MGYMIDNRNGCNIYEYEYEKYRNTNEITSVTYEGVCLRLSAFLRDVLGYDDSVWDVYSNTSGIREGNRIDILDNYKFDGSLEISFIYVIHNGYVSAVLYDRETDKWYGEIEIPAV